MKKLVIVRSEGFLYTARQTSRFPRKADKSRNTNMQDSTATKTKFVVNVGAEVSLVKDVLSCVPFILKPARGFNAPCKIG